MKPINFKEATKVLRRPETMSDDECKSLPVWTDGKQCVSCWKPNFKERLKILFGGKVWLGVMSGRTQPPVFVEGEKVFAETPLISRFKAFCYSIKESITEAWENVTEAAKQADKRKHFIAGFLITLIVGVILQILFNPWSFLFGFVAACVAGAIKEWWDSKGHGTVELLDFAFTAFGASVAVLFLLFVNTVLW